MRVSWIASALFPVVIALDSNKPDQASDENNERQGLDYDPDP
jgi:hypothetical protein